MYYSTNSTDRLPTYRLYRDYRLPTTGNRLGNLVYYHKKDLTPYYGSRVSLSNQRRHNLVELVDCHKRLIAYAPADRLRR